MVSWWISRHFIHRMQIGFNRWDLKSWQTWSSLFWGHSSLHICARTILQSNSTRCSNALNPIWHLFLNSSSLIITSQGRCSKLCSKAFVLRQICCSSLTSQKIGAVYNNFSRYFQCKTDKELSKSYSNIVFFVIIIEFISFYVGWGD